MLTGWFLLNVAHVLHSIIIFLEVWGKILECRAVCVSKWHYIKTGIFGWNRQFFGVPLNLKAIFKRIGKTQNWQFIHISLWDPVYWSIKIDFCVTHMMPPSFIVRGQKFGALSLLRCPSPKRPQIQPVRQKTVHWAVEWALSRKAEAFKDLSGYRCHMFPQNLWLPGP